MTSLVDTSVLIDHLRGDPGAHAALRSAREAGVLHASEITRVEILAGMRDTEEEPTRTLLGSLVWHPVTAELVELAGDLGRRWLRSHRLDAADLVIAATAMDTGADLLTRNVKHFPMFPGLTAPY